MQAKKGRWREGEKRASDPLAPSGERVAEGRVREVLQMTANHKEKSR
ncbi:hypothetical protein GMSM_34690 [Geomonas sp. Red276]